MKLNAKQQKNLKILGFLAPILIFSILFVYYPFCRNLLNSLYAVSDKGELLRFVGLDNFRSVFRRRDFRQFFANTLLLTAINVPVTLFLTILLGRLAMKKAAAQPGIRDHVRPSHVHLHVRRRHDLQIHVQPHSGLHQRMAGAEAGLV